MRIRPARLEDTAPLGAGMKVVADEGRWIATQGDRTADELTERFRGAIEADHIVVLAEEDGRIAGCAGVHPTGVEGVHGLGMWVLPELRGRGLGRRLLESALAAADERGVRKVELEVFPDNGRAIGLYASAGFEVEGLRRDHYVRLDGSVRSALLMARSLPR